MEEKDSKEKNNDFKSNSINDNENTPEKEKEEHLKEENISEKESEAENKNKKKEEKEEKKEEEEKPKEEEEKKDEEEKPKDEEKKENEEENKKDNDENKNNSDEEKLDKDKEKKEDSEEDKKDEENTEIPQERSAFSLEGAKPPLSMYTRRVMDISKIEEYLRPGSTRGQCGGRNLGNTCFMNSSIACLSNTTELTYYFLKGDYKKDINEDNKLGMQGDLAKSWGELMQQYWVENTSVGDPSDFKYTIGRKAKRFAGYRQQDSNEFMSVFLDYLNEDLNRVTKKEYIELKEKQENETDIECSKRFWECNLKRNDSIVTDLFCGQFKSTITCPDCNWVNITFDPFDTINLPLLTQAKRRSHYSENLDEFKFYYITKYDLRNPYCIIVKDVSSKEMLKDLIDRIKKENDLICHDKLDDLLIVDMLRGDKYGFVERITDTLSKYNYSQEYIYSYNYKEKEDDIKMLSYFYENSQSSKSEYPRMIFVNKKSTVNEVRKKVYIYLRKYILSPFLKENQEKDSLSLEIEKYLVDKNLELDDNKLIELIENEYEEVFKYDTEDNEKEKKDEEDEEKEKDDEDNDHDSKKEEEEKNDEEKGEEKKEEEKKNEEDNSKEKNEDEKKKETPKEEEKDKNKKYLDEFIQDLPFTIFFQRERDSYNNTRFLFIDKDNFFNLPKKFKKKSNLKSFKDILDNAEIKLDDYEIHVVFNEDSKYINKSTFELNKFEKYSLDYKKKKEEPKKEDEEEDNGTMTLEKCLKKFCKEEQLEEGDEWYCPKCKKHVLAKKKMDLFYLPKILIICLKRFIKDSDSSYWDKNEDEVIFPVNDMDMKNFVTGPDKDHSKYDLFAVSQHYGSTGGGHYTAVCKNDGKWFSYNDSSCHETSVNDALTSAAYVLFYRRQTD